jgi:signal peptidase II
MVNSVIMPRMDFNSELDEKKSMLHWLWLTALVIMLDQGSKLWADAVLTLYQPYEIFPGLSFTLSHNSGAAFSFLAGAGGWQRWLFVALAFAVSGYIIHWIRRLDRQDALLAAALALILGGALGNVIDRLYLGHVIDFIDVFYFSGDCLPFFSLVIDNSGGSCHWPAFNLADSSITLGAVLLVIETFSRRRPKPHKLYK